MNETYYVKWTGVDWNVMTNGPEGPRAIWDHFSRASADVVAKLLNAAYERGLQDGLQNGSSVRPLD